MHSEMTVPESCKSFIVAQYEQSGFITCHLLQIGLSANSSLCRYPAK